MRLLFLGDIVGRTGRNAILEALPGIREHYNLDFVIINGENAAGGFGITESILNDLIDAGADCVTLGNHAFDQKDTLVFIERHDRLIRPLNFPKGTPGRGAVMLKARNGSDVLVINAMGRVYMTELDCPFRAVDNEITACKLKQGADVIIVDFHAEATSEKVAMGHFLDGRVSAVVGTHTHIPTADAQILPGGTGFQCDAGMCGDYDSVIGVRKDIPLYRFTRGMRGARFEPAAGEATVCGTLIVTDDRTGLAQAIAPVRIGPRLRNEIPEI